MFPVQERGLPLVLTLCCLSCSQCKSGVFPPSGFDPRTAFRSAMLPKAHMWLEHVYGYAGISNLSNNVYYTHNCSQDESEVVYYTGSVGVVFSEALWRR
jgi:lipoxygenase homology domain-containing protein 1